VIFVGHVGHPAGKVDDLVRAEDLCRAVRLCREIRPHSPRV